MDYQLFNAILAMDSYNRGYGASILLPSTIGTKLGNITISATRGQSDAEEIGFYAVAYDIGGAGTIISFRGTDNLDLDFSNPLLLPDDVYHGWSLGSGDVDSEQAWMAIQFYQAVADGVSGDWQTANISLTGHSLGGGLAGFVGGLYDQDAQIFDSMNFYQALGWVDVYSNSILNYREDIKELVYGEDEPWGQDIDGIESTHVEGEALGYIRHPDYDSEEIDLGDDVEGIGAVDRHSMSTLVIRMFADVGGAGDTALETDWRTSAKYFWPVMYDNDFAERIGMGSVSGTLLTNDKYSDILGELSPILPLMSAMTLLKRDLLAIRPSGPFMTTQTISAAF